MRAFLDAMERRDLTTALTLIGPNFTMTFPGAVTMTSLDQLVAWSAPRYRFVRKSFAAFDEAGNVVHCHGTLSGEWIDKTPFNGIRFIDRFELCNGKIVRQDVWNDMAVANASLAGAEQ
ncbi:MAG: nuclear transport factor 2 family protein [Pseudomonadota bacterium]